MAAKLGGAEVPEQMLFSDKFEVKLRLRSQAIGNRTSTIDLGKIIYKVWARRILLLFRLYR